MLRALFPKKHMAPLWAHALFLLGLVLFNLVDGLAVVIGYFLETIIIGVFHACKLFLAVRYGVKGSAKYGQITGYGMIPFFMVHYGMFVGIQMTMLFGMVSINDSYIDSGFALFSNLKYALNIEGMPLVLGSILIINTFYFFANFIKPKRYAQVAASDIFFKPYLRIFIQQITVILSGFFLMFSATATAAAVLLIIIRWLLDSFIYSIRDNSEALDYWAKKFTKEGESVAKTKSQLQQLTE